MGRVDATMTREEAKRMAAILEAYAEGRKIQISGDAGVYWVDLGESENISFTAMPSNYRIKPEAKTRPMTAEEACKLVGLPVKHNYWQNDSVSILRSVCGDVAKIPEFSGDGSHRVEMAALAENWLYSDDRCQTWKSFTVEEK